MKSNGRKYERLMTLVTQEERSKIDRELELTRMHLHVTLSFHDVLFITTALSNLAAAVEDEEWTRYAPFSVDDEKDVVDRIKGMFDAFISTLPPTIASIYRRSWS